MVNFSSTALLAIGVLARLGSAIPAGDAKITYPPTCTHPSTCYTICPTPTTTVYPTNCPKIGIVCPFFRCAPPEPITSTYTHYCRGTSTCSKPVPTTSCDVAGTVPTVTVQGKCQTGCPDPCPLDIKTVAIACPTIPPPALQT